MTAPKLRFKEFDGDWTKVSLDKVSKVFDGTHQTPNYVESGIKFVSVENIHAPYDSDKFITVEAFKKDFKNQPQQNDILMTRITAGEIGATAIVDDREPLAYYVSLALIRPKAVVTTPFLNQYIGTPFFKNELHKRIIHVAFPKKINLGDINECLVSLPDKQEEQTKIASFLSAVDEKISQLTQKHELLSQYKQGMMQKLFSQQIRFKADDGSEFGEWEEKLIKDIADVKGGKRIPKGYPLVNENTGHPYITVSDMNRSYSIDSTNIRYVPLEVVDTIKRYTITDKDIFISVAGTLGIIGKIPTEFNGANLTENADKLTNLKCHQDFLIYLLDSGYLSELIESTATTSAQPKLALYAIEQLEVQIPCPEEQTKIANFLSAIDQKIEVVAQQIEQAKTWKKGLLQQMFI